MKKVIAFFLSFVICIGQISTTSVKADVTTEGTESISVEGTEKSEDNSETSENVSEENEKSLESQESLTTLENNNEQIMFASSNNTNNIVNCNGCYVAGTEAIKTVDSTTSYDSNSHYIYNTMIGTRWYRYTGTGWWGHSSTGWWFSYLAEDGKWYYVRDTWLYLSTDGINYDWYFFDRYGYRLENKFGFVQNYVTQDPSDYSVRSWYYFGATGKMEKGWQYISYKGDMPNWYYFKVMGGDDPKAADGSNIHNNENFTFEPNTNIDSGHNESGNQYPYYVPSFKVKISHKYRQADGSFSITEEYKDVVLDNQDSQGNIVGQAIIYPSIKNIDDTVKYMYSGVESIAVKVAIAGNDSGINFTVNDTTNNIEFIYERPQYTVTLNKGTGISSIDGAGTYYYGASVSINASVNSGYTFSKWSGTYESSDNSYSFTMPAEDVEETASACFSTVKVSVPQCLIGDKNGNSSFIVKSDIKAGNIVVTAPDGFYYKQEGKDDVYAKITAENNTTITKDNQSIKYTISTDGLSSGCWNGSFNIGMELNK